MLSQLERAVRSARRTRNGRSLAPAVEQFEDRRLLSATPSPTALTPAEIRAYYGFNGIEFSVITPTPVKVPGTKNGGPPIPVPVENAGDGRGQTIAIIDEYSDPNIQNDVNVFDKQFNLPAVNLTVIGNVTATDPKGGWEAEESTDVEWAHAIAPGANIVVVNFAPGAFLSAVDMARNYPGVSVVSMSVIFNEFKGELADDSHFTTPSNHNGVNVSFVAASGDDKTGSNVGPEWPSVSPNVLAVGGTALTLSPNGNSELSWLGSQGGKSPYEPEPFYQHGVQSTGGRTTPDVAYDATNYATYDTFPRLNTTTGMSYTPDWAVEEGTSLGAPQWAALIAIANEGRVIQGKPTLTDVPEVFYSLPSTDFNDIVSGPADREGNSPGPGYDEITGLGSPKAKLIVDALLNPPYIPIGIHITAVSAGNVTGLGATPQATQDAFVLESSSSPKHVGALDQPAGSIALSVSPVAVISSQPAVENSLAPLAASGVPVTLAGSGSEGWTSWSPVATESTSVSDSSSLPLLGPVAGPALGEASAAPVSLRFVEQHGGFALPGANVVEVADQVPANAAVHDYLGPQTGWLDDTVPSAGTALLTQATDACFERNTWIVDGANSLLQTPAAAGRQKRAFSTLAVTAGILSASVVRRRLRSAKRTSPDETKS
jgi:hypothetical protein